MFSRIATVLAFSLGPLAVLGLVSRSPGPGLGPFTFLFALAVWLLAGGTLLAAAWSARGSGVRIGRGEASHFVAPLVVLGVMPFAALPAFAGAVAMPGVDAYNLGHAMWFALEGAGMTLLLLATYRPRPAPRAVPLALGVAAAVSVGSVAASPWLPPFVVADHATLAYNVVLVTLAAMAFLASAPLWWSWMSRGGLPTALFSGGMAMLAYAQLGFLVQQSQGEIAPAWFGRVCMVAAGFLLTYAALAAPAPVAEVAAPVPGEPAAEGAPQPVPPPKA